MLQDIIDPIPEQLSIEGIDFPDEEDMNFFTDEISAVGNTANTANTATTTATTAASCDNESLCCYLDDDASFDFDPATISTLLDSPEVNPTAYQLPTSSEYTANNQNQDELSQILLSDTVNNGNWPAHSPDSVIPPETDTDARPGWVPWQCYTPEPVVPISERPQITMLPSMMGYVGLNGLSTCSLMDTGIIGRYHQSMNGGDAAMGYVNGGRMMSGEGEIGMESGGMYRPETCQRLYSSIDMQVMGDYKSLVEGCNSNSMTLPTTDITPLDDSNIKVGRLSPEERKEKIHRYLKKRTERNFNKKIKYACRKTLADSRPRVRGRFARNDEHGEGTSRQSSSNHEYYDEEEVVVKEEHDIMNSSDIFAHISGVNSFNYNYTLESWI